MHIGGGRRVWWAGIAVLVLVVIAGAVALWPQPHKAAAEQPRARQYKPTQTCLLTPPTGLADPLSAQAWAGLEDTSGQTLVQARYLSVAGQDTVGNATPYVASLAVGGCGTVVVAGDAEVQAAAQSAQKFPKVWFVLLGDGHSTGANIKTLTPASPADARAQVASTVAQIVKS